MDAVAIPASNVDAESHHRLWYDAQEDMTYLLVGCENGTAISDVAGVRPIFMGKFTHMVSSCGRTSKWSMTAYIVSEARLTACR